MATTQRAWERAEEAMEESINENSATRSRAWFKDRPSGNPWQQNGILSAGASMAVMDVACALFNSLDIEDRAGGVMMMDAGAGDGTVVHTMQECTQLLPPHTRVLGVEVEKQRVINARRVACDEYGMEMQEATDMFIQADLRRAGDWVPPVPTVVLMNNVEWHHLDSHTRSGAGRGLKGSVASEIYAQMWAVMRPLSVFLMVVNDIKCTASERNFVSVHRTTQCCCHRCRGADLPRIEVPVTATRRLVRLPDVCGEQYEIRGSWHHKSPTPPYHWDYAQGDEAEQREFLTAWQLMEDAEDEEDEMLDYAEQGVEGEVDMTLESEESSQGAVDAPEPASAGSSSSSTPPQTSCTTGETIEETADTDSAAEVDMPHESSADESSADESSAEESSADETPGNVAHAHDAVDASGPRTSKKARVNAGSSRFVLCGRVQPGLAARCAQCERQIATHRHALARQARFSQLDHRFIDGKYMCNWCLAGGWSGETCEFHDQCYNRRQPSKHVEAYAAIACSAEERSLIREACGRDVFTSRGSTMCCIRCKNAAMRHLGKTKQTDRVGELDYEIASSGTSAQRKRQLSGLARKCDAAEALSKSQSARADNAIQAAAQAQEMERHAREAERQTERQAREAERRGRMQLDECKGQVTASDRARRDTLREHREKLQVAADALLHKHKEKLKQSMATQLSAYKKKLKDMYANRPVPRSKVREVTRAVKVSSRDVVVAVAVEEQRDKTRVALSRALEAEKNLADERQQQRHNRAAHISATNALVLQKDEQTARTKTAVEANQLLQERLLALEQEVQQLKAELLLRRAEPNSRKSQSHWSVRPSRAQTAALLNENYSNGDDRLRANAYRLARERILSLQPFIREICVNDGTFTPLCVRALMETNMLDVRLVRDRLTGDDELRSQHQLLQQQSRGMESEARQLRDKLHAAEQKHSTATAKLDATIVHMDAARQKIVDLEAQAQKIQQTAPAFTAGLAREGRFTQRQADIIRQLLKTQLDIDLGDQKRRRLREVVRRKQEHPNIFFFVDAAKCSGACCASIQQNGTMQFDPACAARQHRVSDSELTCKHHKVVGPFRSNCPHCGKCACTLCPRAVKSDLTETIERYLLNIDAKEAERRLRAVYSGEKGEYIHDPETGTIIYNPKMVKATGLVLAFSTDGCDIRKKDEKKFSLSTYTVRDVLARTQEDKDCFPFIMTAQPESLKSMRDHYRAAALDITKLKHHTFHYGQLRVEVQLMIFVGDKKAVSQVCQHGTQAAEWVCPLGGIRNCNKFTHWRHRATGKYKDTPHYNKYIAGRELDYYSCLCHPRVTCKDGCPHTTASCLCTGHLDARIQEFVHTCDIYTGLLNAQELWFPDKPQYLRDQLLKYNRTIATNGGSARRPTKPTPKWSFLSTPRIKEALIVAEAAQDDLVRRVQITAMSARSAQLEMMAKMDKVGQSGSLGVPAWIDTSKQPAQNSDHPHHDRVVDLVGGKWNTVMQYSELCCGDLHQALNGRSWKEIAEARRWHWCTKSAYGSAILPVDVTVLSDPFHDGKDLIFSLAKILVHAADTTPACAADAGSTGPSPTRLHRLAVAVGRRPELHKWAYGPLANIAVPSRPTHTHQDFTGRQAQTFLWSMHLIVDEVFSDSEGQHWRHTLLTGAQRMQKFVKLFQNPDWTRPGRRGDAPVVTMGNPGVSPVMLLTVAFENIVDWMLDSILLGSHGQLWATTITGLLGEKCLFGVGWHMVSHSVYDAAPLLWAAGVSIGATACQAVERANKHYKNSLQEHSNGHFQTHVSDNTLIKAMHDSFNRTLSVGLSRAKKKRLTSCRLCSACKAGTVRCTRWPQCTYVTDVPVHW